MCSVINFVRQQNDSKDLRGNSLINCFPILLEVCIFHMFTEQQKLMKQDEPWNAFVELYFVS